ncbi:MAG: hypothetical protein ABI193_04035 [Minicystis sp.]
MGKKRVPISLRKPPSPEALESFVQAGAPVFAPEEAPAAEALERVAAPVEAPSDTILAIAPEPPSAPEPTVFVMPREREPERQGVFVAEDGQAMRPITIYLPMTLAEQLGRHCLELDRNASRVITDALETHLKRRLGPATSRTDERAHEARATSRPASPFAPGFVRAWIAQAVTPQRVERWLDLGRTFLGGLKHRAQPA